MLYNFHPQFQCDYSEGAFLIYGCFHGERPAWHYVRDREKWVIDVLEKIPNKANEHDKSKLVYRVQGREGNKTRFTYQKIRRLSLPWSGPATVKAIRHDLIPD